MKLPPARATFVIGAITSAAWLIVAGLGLDQVAAITAGFLPERFNEGGQLYIQRDYETGDVFFVPTWLTPLSSTLVHAGILHLAFNLLMLGFCGRFVELARAESEVGQRDERHERRPF